MANTFKKILRLNEAPKLYTLDCKTWRCGGIQSESTVTLGCGKTLMLNEQGYMCCLGQFSIKNNKVPANLVLGLPEPRTLASTLHSGYDINFARNCDGNPLTAKLININDNKVTTPRQKIVLLRKELAKHNLKLRVLNYDFLPVLDGDMK